MKILFISNLYPPHYVGGYELHCAAVAEGLRGLGHEIRVLTSSHGLEAGAPVDKHADVQRSLHLHGHYGHAWLGFRQLSNLEAHNNQMVRDMVAFERPDMVYVWNLGGISKSIIFTLEQLGIPTAYYVSDHWVARSLKADVWLDWWNRSSIKSPSDLMRVFYGLTGARRRWDTLAATRNSASIRFPRLAFCSRALRRLTAENNYQVDHAEIIHCPVDVARYTGEPRGADRPMCRLLYAGRLAEDKGVLTTLKAMALVKGKFEGCLRLYGNGEPEYVSMLEKFVKEHSLPVTFHSASPDQMPEVYRAHDAVLFSSEWEEPFALTPLEAMASGLPVIGTTTGGSAELFRHGANALNYDAGDAKMLAERILELDRHPALRAQMAVIGQRDVRSLCALPVILAQQDAFVRETVAGWSSYKNANRSKAASPLPLPAPSPALSQAA